MARVREVPEAIQKATASAAKGHGPRSAEGRPHRCTMMAGHFGAGKVTVRSAPAGTGIIAGGPMRAVFKAWACADVATEVQRHVQPLQHDPATFEALGLNRPVPKSVAQRRGKKAFDLSEVAGGASVEVAQADAEAIDRVIDMAKIKIKQVGSPGSVAPEKPGARFCRPGLPATDAPRGGTGRHARKFVAA